MLSFILVAIFIAYGIYCLVQLRKEHKEYKLQKQKIENLKKEGNKNGSSS